MKKRSRPTIFDLARHTGVSRGTISRAFNNQPGISSKTQEKILRVAKEIGYSPHNGARMMKLGRTKRWGLLLPHLQNPYYAELVEALNNQAQAQGTLILLGLSNHDKNRESSLITQWTAGETDGLILDQSHYHSNPEFFEQLKAREVPMVFLHGQPIAGFDFVRYQLFDSFARILNHLDALGHTRIGYVGQEFDFCRQTARFRAYVEFHQSRGRKIQEPLIHFGEDGAQGGINAWRFWQRSGNPPTAIVCCDDVIACGVVHAARSSGLQIPRDLSVTGVDDIAEASRLGLTTIHTNREATAKAILELLERRRVAFESPPEVCEIPSELIMRDSIGRPRNSSS
jgi:DNA-binding LacI/PurR family transcriptional regulator